MVNQGREEEDRLILVRLVNKRTVKVKIKYINQRFSMWMRWLILNKKMQNTENRTRQLERTFHPTSWPWINTSMGRNHVKTLLKYLDARAQKASNNWVIGRTTQGTIKDRHLVKISRVLGSKCKKLHTVYSIFNRRRKAKAIPRRLIRSASTMSLTFKNISAQSSQTKFKKLMDRTIRRRRACRQNGKQISPLIEPKVETIITTRRFTVDRTRQTSWNKRYRIICAVTKSFSLWKSYE